MDQAISAGKIQNGKLPTSKIWRTSAPTPSAVKNSVYMIRNVLSYALLALAAASVPVRSYGVSCTPQAELNPQDRDAILAAATPLAAAVANQNLDLLRSSLLSAVVGDWDGIKSAAQGAAPHLKGGTLHWRNAYLLDATDLKATSDTQFFCTNSDSSMTVTINLRSLPPGKYTLEIADYDGAPLAGQLAMILGYEGGWKLGGLFAREGALDGHDGVWYWTQAREQAKKNAGWDAWFDYDTARWLLVPVDFLSSPNLEKLNQEQMRLKSSPIDSLPITVKGADGSTDAGKSWKVTGLRLDTTLHVADLALTYDSSGLTDPLASKAEATAVMSGLLKLHPELRSFHGLWAYADKDGKHTYAIELAMHDIP